MIVEGSNLVVQFDGLWSNQVHVRAHVLGVTVSDNSDDYTFQNMC